ncbi:MAG TPA: hypothetical protein VN605_14900, partial [Thermoanaerobaculia bacterium]|nr:hypothetical protein [Thermoanaerobaculia bacterium]
ADSAANEHEVRQLSRHTSAVLRHAVASLTLRERMLLRLHFVSLMSIADIARILKVPQRPLYRRLQQILQLLRGRLSAAGIDARAAEELIGSAIATLDFGLADGKTDMPDQTTTPRDPHEREFHEHP